MTMMVTNTPSLGPLSHGDSSDDNDDNDYDEADDENENNGVMTHDTNDNSAIIQICLPNRYKISSTEGKIRYEISPTEKSSRI